jgi:hypothetical protein
VLCAAAFAQQSKATPEATPRRRRSGPKKQDLKRSTDRALGPTQALTLSSTIGDRRFPNALSAITAHPTQWATLVDVEDFPADDYLRSARAFADFSQRDLARAAGLPPWVIARIESEPQHARVQPFARALDACSMRLAVIHGDSYELPSGDLQHYGDRRDRAGRRFPAHLDVRPAALGWWGSGWPMFQGREPEFTFDRARWRRDDLRDETAKWYYAQRVAEEAQREAEEAQREADANPEAGPG